MLLLYTHLLALGLQLFQMHTFFHPTENYKMSVILVSVLHYKALPYTAWLEASDQDEWPHKAHIP